MNNHVNPNCVPDKDPAAPIKSDRLLKAAELLPPSFETGKPVEQTQLPAIMEDAFGASDTSDARVWQDAYDACEAAQILMLDKYGTGIIRKADTPEALIQLYDRDCRLYRSDQSNRLRSQTPQLTQVFWQYMRTLLVRTRI